MQCPSCGGTGWLPIQDSLLKRCDCRPPERLTSGMLRELEIPAGFREKGLDNFSPRNEAQARAKEFLLRIADLAEEADGVPAPCSVLLHGPAAAGKTHLATGLLKRLRRNGFPGLFVSHAALLAAVRAGMLQALDASAPADPMQQPRVQRLLNVEVLLLDDVTLTDSDTPSLQDVVPSVIRYRHSRRKAMIVTTRLPLEHATLPSLRLELGYPAVSRLYGMCTILDLAEP